MTAVEFIEGPGDAEIDAFVRGARCSLTYATPWFMALLARHLDASVGWYVARWDGEIVGALPLLCRAGPMGPVMNSLAYYGSNGGVIQPDAGRDSDAAIALVEAFAADARARSSVSATIVGNPLDPRDDVHAALQADLHDERIGQVTHLPPGDEPDDLMAMFADPRPRNIRRARRAGLVVEKRHDSAALDFVYETHAQNMQAIGGLAKARSFFDAVATHVPREHWAVHIGLLDGEPVAALLVFMHNGTVEYFTPVVVEKYRSIQALSLVIFEAMQDARRSGHAAWNWGGTWLTQQGVYDFKKRWGTIDYRYRYFTKVNNPAVFNTTRAFLSEHYRHFYVLPFSALKEDA